MAQDSSDAIRRIEAEIRTLDARMLRASGDLDYESYLYQKRALTAALLTLRKRRETMSAAEAFSQNSASSDRIKGK